MTDLLALSRAAIDQGKGSDALGPLNRINHPLSELDDDLALVNLGTQPKALPSRKVNPQP